MSTAEPGPVLIAAIRVDALQTAEERIEAQKQGFLELDQEATALGERLTAAERERDALRETVRAIQERGVVAALDKAEAELAEVRESLDSCLIERDGAMVDAELFLRERDEARERAEDYSRALSVALNRAEEAEDALFADIGSQEGGE